MTKDERPGSFLSRWSERKHAARRGEELAEQPALDVREENAAGNVPASVPEEGAKREEGGPQPELPPVESLKGLESDYKDFLRPEVDDDTRRAALKKLFADPHFNQMDGLDVYIDDYTQPDPIPMAMLKKLAQAKAMALFEDDDEMKEARQVGAEPDRDAAAQQNSAAQALPAPVALEQSTPSESGSLCPSEDKAALRRRSDDDSA